MRVAKLSTKHYSPKRGDKEYLEDFVAKFIPAEHTTVIQQLMDIHNLTADQAVGLAMAMFCGIQDSMLFHYDIELPEVKLSVVPYRIGDKAKIIKYRGLEAKGTLKGILGRTNRILTNLEYAHNAMMKDPSKLKAELYSEEQKKEIDRRKYYISNLPSKAAVKRKKRLYKKKKAKLEQYIFENNLYY